MLATVPNEEPLAVTLIESPVPPPACIHEVVTINELDRVAVVQCCGCPYQSIATVWLVPEAD